MSRNIASMITIIFIGLCLWAGWHIYHAEATKQTPPVACQLFGGQWNLWDGWVCQ